ncbi:MAG: ribonucleoside-diphosphate reductase subunit alpha [Candidatus Doudnabacteria bacterium]
MYYTSQKQIKKRSGDLVDFDAAKIEVAISKAHKSVKGFDDPVLYTEVTTSVLAILDKNFVEASPSVEDVQNMVEQELMSKGLFDVAKNYIIYRYEHTKKREEKKIETLEKLTTSGLTIIKRNGQKELFSTEKLRKHLSYLSKGYESDIDVDGVIKQVGMEVYEDITTTDIERSLIMVLRSFIEQDPAYSYVAARALMGKNYKEVIGHDKIDFTKLEQQLKEQLALSIQKGVALGRLNPKLLLFDLNKLATHLNIERDNNHNYLSIQTLLDRYFISDPKTKEVIEVPQLFWMRVAMGLALNETNKEEAAINFYNGMSTLHCVPSTPTLFHSGTMRSQLASCYLTSVEDNLANIFKSYADNAQMSKWSGGIGNDWTKVRSTGSLVMGPGIESQGVIPFLKIANDTTVAINRSGKRRGATCAYLETWHLDIEDFLELRKNTGDERRRTHDMNTANWIPDLFMKRVKTDGMWTLFSPNEVPDLHELYGKAFEHRYEQYERMAEEGSIRLFKKIPAKDLWRKMLTMLFETGHPWVVFKDPSNVRSPQDHAGVVHSSNLCTEITLNTSQDEVAVCNLGSVNLAKHITAGQLDLARLQFTISTAMRMLDNVIDLNFYPIPETRNSNMRHRPVGLGIMGFQDALYQLGVSFESEEMVELADRTQEAIAYYAILASTELAKERGAYQSFRGSKWDRGILPVDTIALLEEERGLKIDVDRKQTLDWDVVREAIKKYGMRNSNTMAIAPTATISNIAGALPAIEPIYKNIYVKANQSGDFVVVNSYLIKDLKVLGLWNPQMLSLLKYHDGNLSKIDDIPQNIKDKYKEVFQIDPRWLIKAAAYRGKWIDQSQSLNIFYGGKSGKEINDIYLYAWDMGVKTTYYLRTMAASQVEKSTVNTDQFGKTHLRGQGQDQTEPEANAIETEVVEEVVERVVISQTEDKATVVAAEVETLSATISEPVAATDVNPMFAMNSVDSKISQQDTFKMCRLDNPDCEACQ